MNIVFQVIYLLLPCYVATMAPVIAAKLKILKFLDKPIDFNLKLRKKPLLGRNKTIRGYIVGIIFGMITVLLQTYFPWESLSILPYAQLNPWLLGFLMGFGALFGDSFFSFFKRQLDIKPGKPWIPFDQLDAVIFCVLFTYILYPLTLNVIILSLIATFVLTLLTSLIGYTLSIKKVWW